MKNFFGFLGFRFGIIAIARTKHFQTFAEKKMIKKIGENLE
tara:strand:+ start:232 stop:354 length:123 start_codon:yes stop_codon:yes gene_type:complete